jgi:hypothetical protein
MNEYTQSILGSTLRSKRRDGTIEGRTQEANRVDNFGIARAYLPVPSLITHPVILVFGNSISHIYIALTNDITVLHHAIFSAA